jgi:hypothetical protein
MEHRLTPGRLLMLGTLRSRSLTTADSCRDARWASVRNGPRLHLMMPGARRRDAGSVGCSLLCGGRCRTPERRTGSFDSIGRAPWGPRSLSGRWSQPSRAFDASASRGLGASDDRPERERGPHGRGLGYDAFPSPGQLHPRTVSRSGTLWRTWRNGRRGEYVPRSKTCPRPGFPRDAGR